LDTVVLTLAVFIGVFVVFLFSGWWIAFALASASVLGYILVSTLNPANVAYLCYNSINNYTLAALPIFILMGELLIEGGVVQKLYKVVLPIAGRVRGGLIHTNVIANVILGACCGSTIAATSASSAVAIPELAKRGYDRALCYGSLASAGCIACLIPPSIGLILFAAITDVSLGALFIGGIIPGLLLATSISLVTAIVLIRKPELAPRHRELIPIGRALIQAPLGLWPLLLLVTVVLGAIYTGMCTPTESGCYGVVGALILGYRRLKLKGIITSLVTTIRVFVPLGLVIAMASVYGFVINSLGLVTAIGNLLGLLPGAPWVIMFYVWLFLLLLGMFIDSGSAIILTTPILLPFAISIGFDPIWFGIWLILGVELGNITPPVGLTLYAVQSVSGDKLETIAKGALPYWLAFLGATLLVVFFPDLVLWLVRLAHLT